MIKYVFYELKEIFLKTVSITLILFKIVLPVSIGILILKETGLIETIGNILTPVMSLVGLPGSYGLVWATALFTSTYAAVFVLSNLMTIDPLNTAQITIAGLMILFAHSLPVESSIARQSGIRLRVSILVRTGMAIFAGFILSRFFTFFNLYNYPPAVLWKPDNTSTTAAGWILSELINYLTIFCIIFFLLTLIKTLEKIGIITFLVRVLRPVLKPTGIGDKAIPLVIIGMVLGYGYGGGIIIQEARSGVIDRKDMFYTIMFLSLCHSILEDSLIMISIGCAAVPVVFGRFIIAYLFSVLMVSVTKNMKPGLFYKLFFRPDWKTEIV